MRMRFIAGCAFLLNTILFATYYSVTKEALGRIDPIIFTFFEIVSLVPAGLLIILCSWKHLSRAVVKRGILLGSMLCLALFTIAIALKYTTATSTAFFPALNGFVAALIAWALFREAMKGATWLAGILSLAGAALLIFTSSAGNFRGTLIAFLGGLFYTGYVFLCDHEQKDEQAQWPLLGIELLTTAVWANLIALLFGNWQAVHPVLPRDIWLILYVSVACTFIPTLITVRLQTYISPVSISFIYILEPVLGAIIANLYLGEILSVQGYVGGALVVLGALVNTWASMGRPARRRLRGQATQSRVWWVSALLYPGAGFLVGAILLLRLGGLPPTSWNEVSRIWPRLSQYLPHNQDYVTVLLIQAGGWLIAWISVVLMGCLALAQVPRLLLQLARSPRVVQGRPHPPTSGKPGARPARRRYTTAQPAEPRVRPAPLAHEEWQGHVGVPRRSPGQSGTYTPPTPRARVTRRLSEQPAWYGEAVWRAEPVGNGPAPARSTEPLRRETLRSLEVFRGLPVEKHVQ